MDWDGANGERKSDREQQKQEGVSRVNDRKIWTKKRHELEADMEGKRRMMEAQSKEEWLVTESVDLNKRGEAKRKSQPPQRAPSCSVPHVKMNHHTVSFPGTDRGPLWPPGAGTYHITVLI